MLRGLWKLTWVEIKIFLREPMGAFGSVGIPVLTFVVLGKVFAGRATRSTAMNEFVSVSLPVFAAVLITLSSVLSLITIVSIYREGGILKRLRATPLSPITILTTHVIVKLLLTLVTLVLLIAVGKTWGTGAIEASLPSFALALLFSTLSIMSLGFLIASLVRTARFAQPLGSVLLYPMLGLSGLFFPLESLPGAWPLVAQALPLTHAVALLRGIWEGGAWLDHWHNVAALTLFFVICTALSSRLFRWE